MGLKERAERSRKNQQYKKDASSDGAAGTSSNEKPPTNVRSNTKPKKASTTPTNKATNVRSNTPRETPRSTTNVTTNTQARLDAGLPAQRGSGLSRQEYLAQRRKSKAHLNVEIPADLKAELLRAAKDNGHSLRAEVLSRLDPKTYG